MTEPTSIATLLGIKIPIFIAHLLGNLVSLSFLPPMPVIAKIITFSSGVIVAHYATEIVFFIYPKVVEVDGAIAFFIGIFAMVVVKTTLDTLPETVKRLMGRIK